MNLNWSNRVIKYILFVFNLLFVISGIIMIAVGVSVKSYYTDYDVFLNDSYFSLPNLLIAIGSLIFFISFFGCCGAIKESWFMIFIFSVLLSLIFIMEFSAGIAGYVLRDKTSSFLTDELLSSMSKYKFNDNNTNPTTAMWDTIQTTFKCCGARNAEDWAAVSQNQVTTLESTTHKDATEASTQSSTITTEEPQPNITNVAKAKRAISLTNGRDNKYDLPTSCCKSKTGNTGTLICNMNNTDTSTFYNIGCVEGFGDYLKDHAVTLGGVGFAIAFIQLFAVIFACHLTKQLKNGFYST